MRTVVGEVEAALGRPLGPREYVRRRPGKAGSWNPRNILLFDYETRTITTLAQIRDNCHRAGA